MSFLINHTSSKVAMIVWICLVVLISCLDPSWLLYRIWLCPPYVDIMDVNVLVNSLYFVFASAIGLWFSKFYWVIFLYIRTMRLIFHVYGIVHSL